ncbi:MAG TPA: hypothetical protein VFQ22_06185 [Longimicrobiales bacterium]|nr:hypothetical protein [Longimicrobiales bacterium]
MHRSLTVAAALALLASPVSAQIAWESPALLSPTMPSGFSIFVVNPEGGDLGALGTFRHSAGPVGLGYRAAIADEDPGDDVAFSFGVDVAGMLARGVEGSEVNVIWWTGGGVGLGDEFLVTAPLGIMLGWSGAGDDVIFSPYGGAHVVLDLLSGPGDDVRFEGVVDFGVDLVFQSGWMLRFGASVGDRETLALGLRLPSGSR